MGASLYEMASLLKGAVDDKERESAASFAWRCSCDCQFSYGTPVPTTKGLCRIIRSEWVTVAINHNAGIHNGLLFRCSEVPVADS